ncbi:MAG TPA: hypothetical protein VMQ76_05560 [Terracidiphilus sp.]|nr:hypothetical protein [Terracidiphilus sp.]
MIKTFWNSSRNGIRLLIDNVAAQTGILHQVIDCATIYNRDHITAIELEVKTGDTAPGSTKNLNLNYAFASDDMKTPDELSTCAATLACALQNSASVRRVYTAPVVYQSAQYLHIWFDHDAMDSGAALDMIVRVNQEIG